MDQTVKPASDAGNTRAEEDNTDLTGQTLGDFHILRRLGEGGMGQVYLAEQISLKRKVALKLLKPELAANVKSLERFKLEAESVARATHANIVQVYFIGEFQGIHYMALEYVEGRNLREFVEKKGPPEIFLGLRIISQVAGALQRASELGIVHRDIKPENILLTRKGDVKVADFGLTRVLAEAGQAGQDTSLTQSGVTMGTPLYMSPEQVEAKRDLDPRSDIYSLGVTAYYMFAGHPPFRGSSPFEVAVQHVQNEPPPLVEIRPDLPPELCLLIHKMMNKKPEQRFQTGREIVREVSRLRDALVGVTGGNSAIGLGSGFLDASDAPAPGQQTSAVSASRWLPWAIAGTLAAVCIGILVGWLTRLPNASPTFPSVQPGPAESLNPAPGLFSKSEEEKVLLRLVEEYSTIKGPGDFTKGLKFHGDLGIFYVKEKRWEDADKFFKNLEKSKVQPYRILGATGQAMVLALRDDYVASNKRFLDLVEGEKRDKEKKFFVPFNAVARNNPALAEMIAKALQRNQVNDPKNFPPTLERYLKPPPPTMKGQAAGNN